jgi:uncharacterized membrane protein
MPPSRSERRAGGRPQARQPREAQQLVQQTTLAASFSGPLPPPSTLERYEQVVPGAAERLITMAERNQSHRHALETAAVHHEIQIANRGQISAALVALASIGAGTYIASLGQTVAGTGLIGGVIATIAIAHLKTHHDRRKEREAKAGLMTGRRPPANG